MFYVRARGNVRIAVYDTSPLHRKTIVMLHGWPLSEKIFEYQKNFMINSGYRIITMDFRGFGQSDAPDFGYDYNQLAEDLHTVVRSLELRNFVLCGLDIGGAVAIRYVSRYKNNGVYKLCLFAAAAPCYTQRAGFPYGVTEDFVNSMIRLAYKDRAQLCRDYSNCLLHSQHSDAIRNWFELIALSSSGIGTIQSAYALRDEDLRQDSRRINIPTGIFHGKKDQIVPFELADILRQAIPYSILYTYENSGHVMFYDEKDSFNEQLLEFIEHTT